MVRSKLGTKKMFRWPNCFDGHSHFVHTSFTVRLEVQQKNNNKDSFFHNVVIITAKYVLIDGSLRNMLN